MRAEFTSGGKRRNSSLCTFSAGRYRLATTAVGIPGDRVVTGQRIPVSTLAACPARSTRFRQTRLARWPDRRSGQTVPAGHWRRGFGCACGSSGPARIPRFPERCGATPSWGHRDLVLVGGDASPRRAGYRAGRENRPGDCCVPTHSSCAASGRMDQYEYLLGADLADWALYVCLATQLVPGKVTDAYGVTASCSPGGGVW